MNATIYSQIKKVAHNINDVSPEMGFFAIRKAEAVSEKSDLKVLVQVADDLLLIAKRLNISELK